MSANQPTMHIKKGDTVKVITGAHKGKTGKVLRTVASTTGSSAIFFCKINANPPGKSKCAIKSGLAGSWVGSTLGCIVGVSPGVCRAKPAERLKFKLTTIINIASINAQNKRFISLSLTKFKTGVNNQRL